MNDKQLRAFISVAESKSFSKAESRLFLTRQAIQKQIVSLETELGEELFFSSRSGASLTPFGEFLLPEAKKLLNDHDELVKKCINNAKDKLYIRIGNSLEKLPPFFTDILDHFKENFPNAEIDMRYVSFDDKSAQLQNHSVDFVLDYVERTWQSDIFEYFTLYEIPYTCYVSADSDLAEHETITLEDLSGRTVSFWHAGNKRLDTIIGSSGLDIHINELDTNNIINLIATCSNNDIFISKTDIFQNDLPVKRIPFDSRYTLTAALIFLVPASVIVKSFMNSATEYLTDKEKEAHEPPKSLKERLGHTKDNIS